MTVLTISIDPELTVEARLRLKDRLADLYRAITSTTKEIGIDVVPAAG